MANGVKIFKVGEWDKIQKKIDNLKPNIEKANNLAMRNVVLLGERMAVTFMQSQALSWKPLNKRYLAMKIKKGGSNKILFDTSTYFQSIRSWVNEDVEVTGYVGIRRNVMYKGEDGEQREVANIALIHEYGSPARNIPARPLWRPVQNRIKQFIKSRKPFIEEIKKQI